MGWLNIDQQITAKIFKVFIQH